MIFCFNKISCDVLTINLVPTKDIERQNYAKEIPLFTALALHGVLNRNFQHFHRYSLILETKLNSEFNCRLMYF